MTKESYRAEKTMMLSHLATLIGYVVMAVLLLAAITILASYSWLALGIAIASLAGLIYLHTQDPPMSILDDIDDLIRDMRSRGIQPDYVTIPDAKLRRFVMVLNDTTGAGISVDEARARLNGAMLPPILYRDIPVRFGHSLGAFRNPKPGVQSR